MFQEVPNDAFDAFNLTTLPLRPRLRRTYKVVCQCCLNITTTLHRNELLPFCFPCINTIIISKHVKSFLVRKHITNEKLKLNLINKWCNKQQTYLPNILFKILHFLL